MNVNDLVQAYVRETAEIANKLDQGMIKKMLGVLFRVKAQKGRVFFIGLGGSAATGSHAVNDFHKIGKVQALCLSDNMGLLTALANDEGWEVIFKRQLEMHSLNARDCLCVFSSSGGDETIPHSKNLVVAIRYAKQVGCKVLGIVGKEKSDTAREADFCLIVPKIDESRYVAHSEDFHLVLNHLFANVLGQDPQLLLAESLCAEPSESPASGIR